jgi:lysophospholipase L1-like esterase
MHNINDLSTLFFDGSYWNNNPTISTISCANKNIDRNLKNDQWKYSTWYNKLLANKIEQDKIIKLFEENLKIFIAISRSKNITPVLMTQANRIENDPNFKTKRNNKELDQLYQNLYIKFNNSIRKIALEQNILLIDLAKQIPGDKKYIYDVVHFNKEGSVLAGKLIANQLAPLVIKLNKLK